MSKQKSSEVNLTNLYHELQKFAQNGEYSNPRALNVANKILKASRQDETAFHCKVVCLIHQGQFQIALKEIVNNPALASGLSFEKAYCQYRQNKIPEALATIRNVSDPSPKLQELLGQVLYRLDQFDECLDVYKKLIKNTSDDYEEERQTNLSAVIAALKLWNDTDVDDLGLKEDTYELSYNRACLLIGQGRYQEALKQLDSAEELCREMEEEGDDIEGELGVISVQKAFCLQMQGKNEEALKLYNQFVKARPSDIGVVAVASANIISLNKDQNVFDSKKKVKATTAPGVEFKLAKAQRNAIAFNRFLLLLYTNQFEQCRKLLATLKEEDFGDEILCLLQASLLSRQKDIPKAIQLIQDYVDSHDDASLPLQLTAVQLFLLQGNIGRACDMLKSLNGTRYKPGIVSTLVALYTGMEDSEAAIGVLDEAVEWYKSQGGPQSELNTLLRENTAFKLRTGQSQAATSMLEDLRKSNPGDIKTLAQLISAYSKFDPKRAQELSLELPSVAQLSGDVDVDVLESTPLSLSARQLRKAGKGEAEKAGTAASLQEVTKKRKRKRKPHLPKNFDPSVTPDPERWLPIRERSYFKGKRRRDKKGGVGKGTQGATGGAGEMDASKPSSVPNSPRPGSQANSSTTASPSAAIPPRQQKPSSSGAKKRKPKKKGGKW
ncbi:signal recognition particle subunit SRP72-like [Diadema antillarum]|uniref:signal recognition particle subunit SRP72-like n=1 Tax=Diadema antillarum TaxID=105358 RepID=UPI003A87C456